MSATLNALELDERPVNESSNQIISADPGDVYNGKDADKRRRKRRKSKKKLIENGVATAHTFCQNSSLRGVPKLIKHRNLGLRFLWVVFIITMLCLLIYGSISLIVEYLTYKTLINTRESHSSVAQFPSVTICNHHPFRHAASSKWKSGTILSPREFSEKLRAAMKTVLKSKRLKDAKDLFFSDTLTSYFETIGLKQAEQIGHDNSSVKYCILQLKNSIRVGHGSECGIHYSVFQHPKFFNCHTLKVLSNFTQDTVALGLVVRVGEEPDYSNWEMGLVQDVFNQAHGTRITLHEPNTYPDPVSEGINLEAGKFTEIKFAINKYSKTSSPKEACIKPENLAKTNKSYFEISGTRFNYTYELCKLEEFANTILNKCYCYSSLNPLRDNRMIADDTLPYCNAINGSDIDGTIDRLHCLQNASLFRDSGGDEADEDAWSECERRCQYYTYDVHSSTSRWVSSDWQLYWLMKLSDTWIDLETSERDSAKYNESMEDLNVFLDSKNLTDILNNSNPTMNAKMNVFFVVTRTSFLTTEKLETLSLTASALLSRIGGLSSLTLGVTFATLFEVIEFMVLCYQSVKTRMNRGKDVFHIHAQLRPFSSPA